MTRDSGGGDDRTVLLFLLALGALLPPGLWIWTDSGRPWWALYAVWFAVIAATAALRSGSRR